ncbi:MAG: GNAT family N-acetyltransferase [Saprospiraceae bacterium]
MKPWLAPIHLEGEKIKLVPLTKNHRNRLLQAASDGKLWQLWYTSVPSSETIDSYIETALQQNQNQQSLAFVIIHKDTNTIVGTTRYCNVNIPHRRLEIGYTWYAKSFQRTGVNTECKYLLLQNAFEEYKAVAVEIRTHFHNHPSRKAIARLGAKQDGILRNHKIHKGGQLRDTVVFSIIESEWTTVKHSLEFKMKQYDS